MLGIYSVGMLQLHRHTPGTDACTHSKDACTNTHTHTHGTCMHTHAVQMLPNTHTDAHTHTE